MTFERFVDRKDKRELVKNAPDFTYRRHGMPSTWILYTFVSILLCVIILINYMSVKLILMPKDEEMPLSQIIGILLAISTLIAGMAVFSYVIIQKIRDVVLETEFQNLFLAKAASINTAFCLVANKSKSVLYHDQNFTDLFSPPQNKPCVIEDMLSHEGITEEDKEVLLNALANGGSAEISLIDGDLTLRIQIYPLSRPAGTSVIKGYQRS